LIRSISIIGKTAVQNQGETQRKRSATDTTTQKDSNRASSSLLVPCLFPVNPTMPNTPTPTPANPRILALFDVDGTLTIPRGEVTADMMTFLKDLSAHITVGIVGGKQFLTNTRCCCCSALPLLLLCTTVAAALYYRCCCS
jgi:hypothetical protein